MLLLREGAPLPGGFPFSQTEGGQKGRTDMEFTYKGLTAVYTRHSVTGDEVDQQLERLRQQTPREVPVVGRSAAAGDVVELDYAGFCEGEQFEGGTAEHQTLVLGSGTFIPGFEEQLMGANPGDQVTVKVTFPQQYHAAHLAGKDAEFRCTVHRVFRREAQELDDGLARAMGLDTLEQLRGELWKSMQEYADQRGELDLQDRLLRQAAVTLDVSFAPEEIEKAVEEQMETLAAQLQRQNLTVEMYCQFTGKTPEALREDARGEAEQILRLRAAVDEIARREGLQAEEAEVAAELREICRQNQITMEQLQAAYDDAFAAAVAQNIKTRKAMALVRREAQVREEA